ncbi:putative LOB domain-containing protein [Melia azedarach]|uniref:LOB domain-containing protein n=1 Tax=Melia azedarach TaxID=155640 RepID=A0ACC1YVQ0_MELAZ|nr:putative LOB domain-containing protein [Melia azedarach]
MNANNGGGPCGACKFLRRKCVKGCVFAPYFDADQGTAHFAAVHKVFGASNASKLLMRIPVHKRLDAVVTLCYEALARARDPVYGCVGHIVALQQQVVNLQAELAYTQARLAILQRLPLPSQAQSNSPPSLLSSAELASAMEMSSSYNISMHFDPMQPQQLTPADLTSSLNPFAEEVDDGDLRTLAREFVSKYLPGVKIRPSSSD